MMQVIRVIIYEKWGGAMLFLIQIVKIQIWCWVRAIRNRPYNPCIALKYTVGEAYRAYRILSGRYGIRPYTVRNTIDES